MPISLALGDRDWSSHGGGFLSSPEGIPYITTKDQIIKCSLNLSSDIMNPTMRPDAFWVRSWGLSGISLDTIVFGNTINHGSCCVLDRVASHGRTIKQPTTRFFRPSLQRYVALLVGRSVPASKRWHESCTSLIGLRYQEEWVWGQGCYMKIPNLKFK